MNYLYVTPIHVSSKEIDFILFDEYNTASTLIGHTIGKNQILIDHFIYTQISDLDCLKSFKFELDSFLDEYLEINLNSNSSYEIIHNNHAPYNTSIDLAKSIDGVFFYEEILMHSQHNRYYYCIDPTPKFDNLEQMKDLVKENFAIFNNFRKYKELRYNNSGVFGKHIQTLYESYDVFM